MPRKPAAFEQMRQTARENILRSALELFKSNGIHATSIAAIASRARVSKGLAYHYFSSKDELVARVIEDWIDRLLSWWEGASRLPDPRQALKYVLDRFCESLATDPATYRLYLTTFLQLAYLREVYKHGQDSVSFNRKIKRIASLARSVFRQLGSTDPDREVIFFHLLTSGLAAEFTMAPQDFPLADTKRRILSCYERKEPTKRTSSRR